MLTVFWKVEFKLHAAHSIWSASETSNTTPIVVYSLVTNSPELIRDPNWRKNFPLTPNPIPCTIIETQ